MSSRNNGPYQVGDDVEVRRTNGKWTSATVSKVQRGHDVHVTVQRQEGLGSKRVPWEQRNTHIRPIRRGVVVDDADPAAKRRKLAPDTATNGAPQDKPREHKIVPTSTRERVGACGHCTASFYTGDYMLTCVGAGQDCEKRVHRRCATRQAIVKTAKEEDVTRAYYCNVCFPAYCRRSGTREQFLLSLKREAGALTARIAEVPVAKRRDELIDGAARVLLCGREAERAGDDALPPHVASYRSQNNTHRGCLADLLEAAGLAKCWNPSPPPPRPQATRRHDSERTAAATPPPAAGLLPAPQPGQRRQPVPRPVVATSTAPSPPPPPLFVPEKKAVGAVEIDLTTHELKLDCWNGDACNSAQMLLMLPDDAPWPPHSPAGVMVHGLRAWCDADATPTTVPFANGDALTVDLPPMDKISFFDQLSGLQSWMSMAVWTVRVGGMPHLVLYAGHATRAACVPYTACTLSGGLVDGEGYVHIVSAHPALKAFILAMVKAARGGHGPNAVGWGQRLAKGSVPDVPLRTPGADAGLADDGSVVHLAMLCDTTSPAVESSDERVQEQAHRTRLMHYYMMLAGAEHAMRPAGARPDRVREARRLLAAPSDTTWSEMQWMRMSEAKLKGDDKKLLTYAPPTLMDKGHLVIDDYQRLRQRRFLSGDLINYYLMERVADGREGVCVFPTLFFSKWKQTLVNTRTHDERRAWVMQERNLPRAFFAGDPVEVPPGTGARSAKKRRPQHSVTAFTKLVVPMHDVDAKHWTLGAVTNVRALAAGGRTAHYVMDSLSASLPNDKTSFMVLFPTWLAYRLLAENDLRSCGLLRGGVAGMTDFDKVHAITSKAAQPPVRVPRQQNAYDCGLHVLLMAEAVANFTNDIDQCPTVDFDPATAPTALRKTMKRLITQRAREEEPDALMRLEQVEAGHVAYEAEHADDGAEVDDAAEEAATLK